MSQAQTTTDHNEIRRWAEARDGHPARVETDEPGGILRIDFDRAEDNLEEISWDEFFEIFDQNELAFLYQEKVEGGRESRFNKFVRRDS